jgi:hypothetical protein
MGVELHLSPLFPIFMSVPVQGFTWDRELGAQPQWGPRALSLTVSLPIGFQEVGWYPGLQERYRQAIPNVTVPNTTCHIPRPDAFHMLRDPVDGDIPWPGLMFGLTVIATWCWCTDQVMLQQGLA